MSKLCLSFVLLLFVSLLYAQPQAPDFAVTDSEGQNYSLYADFLDQGKTVVIDIFFVACPPCLDHAPHLEALYQEWGSGNNDVEFIALSNKTWDSNQDVKNYKTNNNLTYLGVGEDGGSISALNIYENGTYGPFFGTPTYVVIAPNGDVNYDVVGSGISGTMAALDAAISATGAIKPSSQVNYDLSGIVSRSNGGSPVSGVQVFINDNPSPYTTLASGTFTFPQIPQGTSVELLPVKNKKHNNGVTTFDIVLTAKHILDVTPLGDPYKMIAADVNNSGSITTFDLVLLRKLILQIDTAFNQVNSWQFIPSDFVFSNPANPFLDNIPNAITINNLNQNQSNLNFTAIKSGDVNDTANPLEVQSVESRNHVTPLKFIIEDINLVAGELYTVDFKAKDFKDILGFQGGIKFHTSHLKFKTLLFSNNKLSMGLEHFNIQKSNEGWLGMSWNGLYDGTNLNDDEIVFSIQFEALENGKISKLIDWDSNTIVSEAYTKDGFIYNPKLEFRKNETLSLFPNPTKGNEVNIRFNTASKTEITYTIFDINGKKVTKKSIGIFNSGKNRAKISINELSNGTYLLQVSDQMGNQIGVSKLIKE